MDIKHKLDRRTRGFFESFQLYPVTEEWADELYNYFIMGWPPGSFHTAVLANDLTQAAFKSHPMNEWKQIREFVKWVFANAPADSVGSYENVENWLAMSASKRKKICINRGWMLTDEELTWALVKEGA